MPHLVYGSVYEQNWSGDGYHHNPKTAPAHLVSASANIDIQWLKAASSAMCISDQLSDYVLNDVGIVLSDFPNRKMQCFPLEELLRYDPVTLGRQIYEGFRGKCCFLEHDNQDPTKAKGLILDTRLVYIPTYDVWKIHCLCGWDKTKDRAVATAVQSNELKTFSMGAWVGQFVCSVCNSPDPVTQNRCIHMMRIGESFNGRLAFQMCYDVLYFEISAVSTPADPSAFGELLIGL